MTEYIEREEFYEQMNATGAEFSLCDALEMIETFPAADVAPVRHGWWLHTDLAYHWTSLDECSVCGYHDKKRRHLGDYSYCPNCGAKMDVEVQNA